MLKQQQVSSGEQQHQNQCRHHQMLHLGLITLNQNGVFIRAQAWRSAGSLYAAGAVGPA
jgi:hypothetical protein